MPLPFDSFTLASVRVELQSLLPGSVLEAALQPAPDEIVLRLFKDGTARYLLLSSSSQTARVHLTVLRRPATPVPVPALCAAVRKSLEGATLTEISLPFGFGERTLALSFTTPQSTQYVLYAETQGARSNLVLVDPSGRILDAARRVGKSVNRVRQTLPGLTYVAPPPQTRADGSLRLDPFAPFVPDTDTLLSPGAARTYLLGHLGRDLAAAGTRSSAARRKCCLPNTDHPARVPSVDTGSVAHRTLRAMPVDG